MYMYIYIYIYINIYAPLALNPLLDADDEPHGVAPVRRRNVDRR